MHSRASGLHAVLLSLASAVALTACPTAAPAPCLIQRPPLQGYTIKFTLQGTPPAGCENVLPAIYADNWRFDGFSDQAIYVKSDSMPYPDTGGPNSPVLGHGTFSEVPDADNICTIPDITPMTSDTDVLGLGLTNLVYHPKNLRFLDGARYQGSEFEGEVDITFGTCTGTYQAQGLTPSPIGSIGPCEDDSVCDPFGDPAKGIFASGINPDYAVSCVKEDWVTNFLTGDPTQGICFFTKPFPGLK
ncbi:MAG TPA: hypothetical protein VMT11_08790 [Myxococcaceae bacterium]|nr:hypothetical protein [Myxococcaceae bacterium]